MFLVFLIVPNTVSLEAVPITHEEIIIQSRHTRHIQNSKYWTNKWCSKLFKVALKSKVNHVKKLEVTGQGEILASNDFDLVTDQPAVRAFVTPPCCCTRQNWQLKQSYQLHNSYNITPTLIF